MKFRWCLAAFMSGLISCLVCWPAIFQGRVFFFGDNFHLVIPQKIFIIDQVKNGVLPFWNPYILGGNPFFADIGQSLFYPSTLLFLTFSIEKALLLTVFIHLLITGVGQYFFSKVMKGSDFASIAAMTVWILSQPLLMTINHVNITLLQTVTWLPWILGLFVLIVREKHRKAAILLPMFLSLAILGGHPQPLLYLIFPSLIYLILIKKNVTTALLLLIPGMLVAFLLTCFNTLPFLELMGLSTRTSMNSVESLGDSVKLLHYIDLLIPNIFSDPSAGLRWGIYWIDYRKAGVYITWIGLFFYTWFIGRRNKTRDDIWLSIVSFGTLIAALGVNFPGLKYLVEKITPLQSVRNYSLILILWPLTVSVILGKMFDTLEILHIAWRKIWYLLIITTVTLSAFLLVIKYFFLSLWKLVSNLIPSLSTSTFHTFSRDQVISSHTLTNVLISSFFCLLFVSILITKNRFKRILLLVVFITDLYFSAKTILVFGNSNVYQYQNNPINVGLNLISTHNYRIVSGAGYVPYTGIPDYWAQHTVNPPFVESGYSKFERQSNEQLIIRRNIYGSNWNIPYRLQSPFGTSTFVLKSTAAYWKTSLSKSFNVNEVDNPKPNDYRYIDQGVKYFVVDKDTLTNSQMSIGLDVFPAIQSGNYWSVLENSNALPIIRFASGSATVTSLPGTVNQINFKTESDAAGYVLVKTAYYPGWRCMVDDHPCVIDRNDFTMKIWAEKGIHSFNLSFVPNGWPYLPYISGFTWLLYITVLIKRMRYVSK